MSAITIEMPEVIRQQMEETQEMPRFALEAVALEGYRQALLSHRQVGQMLGLDYWEAEAFLKAHKVYPNYGLEAFQQDLATLERLRQKHP